MSCPTMRATKPTPTWPRPRLVHDHSTLFREATYQDGQPYADNLDEDDEDA